MKWYIELTLIPDSDIPIYFLWEKSYRQLHLALAENSADGKQNVGISFPEYRIGNLHPLGQKLRLLANNQKILGNLDLKKYFNCLSDYIHRTSIKEIPKEKITGYACFKRVQFKSNIERLARRRANKLKTNYEEALDYFLTGDSRIQPEKMRTEDPFIYLYSESKKQRFPLFIVIEETNKPPSENAEFSSYGLSNSSPVPLF